MSLTSRDTEIIVAAFQCFKDTPKVDYEKLAELAKFKNAATATAQYSSLKKKLTSLAGASGSTNETPTPKAAPQKGKTAGNGTDPVTATPKKTKAKTPKSTVKAEESPVKAEETTDTNAADDADNEDSIVPTPNAMVAPTKKRGRGPTKPKYDADGNVINPKKRMSAAQKATQKAADEAAEAEAAVTEAKAEQNQKHTDNLVTRLLNAQANGIGHTAYEDAVSDGVILQENGDGADVKGEGSVDGDGDVEGGHKMTQSEQDEMLFDTSMYEKGKPVDDEKADQVDAEKADHVDHGEADAVDTEEA